MTPWGFMDPELAASLALLDEVDPYDLDAHRAYLHKTWAAQAHVAYPRVTLGYLSNPGETEAPPVKLRTYWNGEADPLAPAVGLAARRWLRTRLLRTGR